MLKKLLLVLFVISPLLLKAQDSFKEGYYLNENDNKIKGYIKDEGWSNSPNFIVFKKTLSGNEEKILSNNIKEFEILGISKFKKFKVKIYNNKINDSNNRKLTYEEEFLLLNTLLEGSVNLYMFNGNNRISKTFFVEKENGDFLQLINFNVNLNNKKLILNSTFKEDLKVFLKRGDLNFDNLKYKENSLAELVENYNQCKGVETIYYNSFNEKIKIFLIPKVGVSYNSFIMKNQTINFNETANGFGYALSTEIEFSLPYNLRKWSIIVEPSYTSYKAEKNNAKFNSGGINVEDSRFQISFGARKYFPVNKNHIYTTISFMVPFSNDTKVAFSSFGNADDLIINISPSFSIGYRINSKIYLDLNFRYYKFSSFENVIIDTSNFSTIMSVGYNLF